MGDHSMRSCGIIPEPVVSSHLVRAHDTHLLLASDGVWQFVENLAAVELLQAHPSATDACARLVATATDKWAQATADYCDDITAVCVDLNALWGNDGVERPSAQRADARTATAAVAARASNPLKRKLDTAHTEQPAAAATSGARGELVGEGSRRES